jgi:hypothetical protein
VLYLYCSITSTTNENKELSKWWQIVGTESIFIYSDGKWSICKLLYQPGSVLCNRKIDYSPLFTSFLLFFGHKIILIVIINYVIFRFVFWLLLLSLTYFISDWISFVDWMLYVLYFLIRYVKCIFSLRKHWIIIKSIFSCWWYKVQI